MDSPTITTVLFDLDGVIRHFDPDRVAEVERRHGLRAGLLHETAFTPSLLEPAITGGATRAEWTTKIGELIGNADAAKEGFAFPGQVDWAIVALTDQLREAAITVAILTNGTDTIPREMIELGLVDHFDAIFSTFFIGYAKPDSRAFRHVCDALDVEPASVFFTDDSPGKLTGAVELGITARPFTSLAGLKRDLTELGVL